MQRYFIPAEQFGPQSVIVTGDDAHHIANVMRAKPGDAFIAADGAGREAIARITELSRGEVRADITELRASRGEPAVRVTIAQALPKGDKMETVIQKGVEIGADRFLPFISERTIVQYDAKKEARRLERWNKIAKEAAEQAHRGKVPQVEAVRSWQQMLQRASQSQAAFLCYEKSSMVPWRQTLCRLKDEAGEHAGGIELMLIVGPEGGFTDQEVQEAESAGCAVISLGNRILRTETAALAGLACILYEFGEMGG